MKWVSNTMHRTPVTSSPPATKLGQGYVLTRVCDSVHGGSASVHAGIHHLPPGAGTLPPSRRPKEQSPPAADPQEQRPPRADPLGAVHAGRYGQQASGTHLTGTHTCFALQIVKTPDNLCYFDSKSILSVIFLLIRIEHFSKNFCQKKRWHQKQ